MIKRAGYFEFFISVLTIILTGSLQAQEDSMKTIYLVEPMVINRYSSMVPWWSINRSLDVIDTKTIQRPGTISIEEVLRSGADVDLQSRGPFGVQTDISLRGSLFSQSLILINGVPFSDPQTAHHNFDVPIPTAQIDRIEVLKGSGSAQYGANAFGGVINIITKEPEKTSGSIRLSGGQNGLFDGIGSIDISPSFLHSSNSLQVSRSDGYRYDTEFSIFNFITNTKLELPIGSYSFLGGYSKKNFGAYDFYSPGRNRPSKEWTETTLLNLSTVFNDSSMEIAPRIYFRKHYDKFMYDLRIPDRFINMHTTQLIGGEIKGFFNTSRNLNFIAGIEANYNEITSTALGNHIQSLFAAYSSLHFFPKNHFITNLGLRGDFHSNYGTQISPTADLGYLFPRGRIFTSVSRSFRAPSYTDLYYSDPSTKGNQNLKPEIGWTYELGYEYGTFWVFSISVFEQDQKDLIDYVRFLPSDTQYVAVNYTKAKTRGIDTDIRWKSESIETELIDQSKLSVSEFSLSYEYLDSYIDRGNIFSSRYAFTHPRHRLSAYLSATFPYSIGFFMDVKHNIKIDGSKFTLVEARIVKPYGRLILFLRGTNLLNESYEEIVGVPLPGRWIWGGIELKVF